MTDDQKDRGGDESALSPALIATLITIPVMVIVGFIVFAALKHDAAPSATPVESYRSTAQGAENCAPFIAALPESFGDYAHKTVTGDMVKWTSGSDANADPLVLNCGVSRPDDLAPTSALQVIDPVQWFITDTIDGRGQAYVVVDRRPYVAVWVPANAGNGPLTDISGVIAQKLPSAPLDFGN
ncbi:MAG: DUF3515 domain-containing protein [Gordonia sp. (in: high G+C Gram-positive bacteria)]|uniref:DUF3515 domain-containing protein n=1 Tax=Gordonia sp. (in: high G+C Gram-positive bacteria) TaxID=84139 RepID=UPI0039E58D38